MSANARTMRRIPDCHQICLVCPQQPVVGVLVMHHAEVFQANQDTYHNNVQHDAA